ncbi:Hypothetical predicted protein [Podarcis lilfordi]|uniref:Uncharacterized protein n=1 Tax=Podarcis lilfordi TaxID=74358 RepID=A0AA35JWE0_9SAUR|nr:Hypothetical predicted protein [Podarcis lilfordi]
MCPRHPTRRIRPSGHRTFSPFSLCFTWSSQRRADLFLSASSALAQPSLGRLCASSPRSGPPCPPGAAAAGLPSRPRHPLSLALLPSFSPRDWCGKSRLKSFFCVARRARAAGLVAAT